MVNRGLPVAVQDALGELSTADESLLVWWAEERKIM